MHEEEMRLPDGKPLTQYPSLQKPCTGSEALIVVTVNGQKMMEGKATKAPSSEREILALFSMIYGNPHKRHEEFPVFAPIPKTWLSKLLSWLFPATMRADQYASKESAYKLLVYAYDFNLITEFSYVELKKRLTSAQ